jgi:hypothetical protein
MDDNDCRHAKLDPGNPKTKVLVVCRECDHRYVNDEWVAPGERSTAYRKKYRSFSEIRRKVSVESEGSPPSADHGGDGTGSPVAPRARMKGGTEPTCVACFGEGHIEVVQTCVLCAGSGIDRFDILGPLRRAVERNRDAEQEGNDG